MRSRSEVNYRSVMACLHLSPRNGSPDSPAAEVIVAGDYIGRLFTFGRNAK